MSAPALAPAAHAVDRRRARSKQRKLGPSALGTCRRRAGYVHHGTKPTDQRDNKMAAIIGTWLHKGILDALRSEYGAFIELPVADDMVLGHADAYYLDDATLEDVKTKSVRAMDYLVGRPPRRSELYQTFTYARLLREGKVRPLGRHKGLPDGPLPVERIRIRYVCRDNGDELVVERDYDEDLANEAVLWAQEVLRSHDPEDLPRDENGPGLSVICDNCPFLTACWGPQEPDGPAPQSQLVTNPEELAAALAEYLEAAAAEKVAKEAKSFARAKLDGHPQGEYAGYKLAWSGGKPGAPKPDLDAMVALFEAAGLEIPQRATTSSVSIRVTRAKS